MADAPLSRTLPVAPARATEHWEMGVSELSLLGPLFGDELSDLLEGLIELFSNMRDFSREAG